MALQGGEIFVSFLGRQIGGQNSVSASRRGSFGKFLKTHLQNGIEIAEQDRGASVRVRRWLTSSSTPARVVPPRNARSLARWMTGPSATGSLNGTPSSIMSAPASAAASTILALASSEGSPAVM